MEKIILLLLSIALLTYGQLDTVIYTGFETGTLSGWINDLSNDTLPAVIVDTQHASGSKCVRYVPTGSGKFGKASSLKKYREYYISFWQKNEGSFPCVSCGWAGHHLFRVVDWDGASWGNQWDGGAHDNSMYFSYLGNGSSEWPSSAKYMTTTAWSTTGWYKVIFKVKHQSSTSARDAKVFMSVAGTTYVDSQTTNICGTTSDSMNALLWTNYDYVNSLWFLDDIRFIGGPGAYDWVDSAEASPSPSPSPTPTPTVSPTATSSLLFFSNFSAATGSSYSAIMDTPRWSSMDSSEVLAQHPYVTAGNASTPNGWNFLNMVGPGNANRYILWTIKPRNQDTLHNPDSTFYRVYFYVHSTWIDRGTNHWLEGLDVEGLPGNETNHYCIFQQANMSSESHWIGKTSPYWLEIQNYGNDGRFMSNYEMASDRWFRYELANKKVNDNIERWYIYVNGVDITNTFYQVDSGDSVAWDTRLDTWYAGGHGFTRKYHANVMINIYDQDSSNASGWDVTGLAISTTQLIGNSDSVTGLNPNWVIPTKTRIKTKNRLTYIVDPIFAARADSSRHLFKGAVASPAIHAKSWNIGGDTTRYSISATQLNQCGTSGLWQFKFLASDLNITDSIYRYWPYGTNIDTSSTNELKLRN